MTVKGKSDQGHVMRVAGAMSGTSMDGVDLAVIETDGVAVMGFGDSRYRPESKHHYSQQRDRVRIPREQSSRSVGKKFRVVAI